MGKTCFCVFLKSHLHPLSVAANPRLQRFYFILQLRHCAWPEDKSWQTMTNDEEWLQHNIDYSILLMSSMTVLSPLFPSRFTSCGSCFCICCRCSSHFTLCVNTFWNCLYFYLYLVSQLQPLHPLWIHFDMVCICICICICICCRSSSHFILCEDVFESLASKSLFWEIFFLGKLRKLRVIMSNKEANYDFGRGI